MHLSHLLIQAIAWLSRFLTFIQSNIKNARTRKSILFVGFGSLFLLYGTSKYLLPAHRHFHKSHTARRPKTLSCLDPYLGKWNLAMKASDAVFKEIPESTKENRFFSFTGNGYIGLSADGAALKFYFLDSNNFYESTFVPVLYPSIKGATKKRQAILLNVKEGSVQLLSTFLLNKSCVAITQLFYAHRVHKSIFHQEITVSNDGILPLTVSLSLHEVGKDNRFYKHTSKTSLGEDEFRVVEGELATDQYEALFSTGMSDFPSSISVPRKSLNKVSFVSVTKYNITKHKVQRRKRKQRKSVEYVKESALSKNVTKELIHTSKIKAETFVKQHISGWGEIWNIGVGIDSESDPDSPSSLHVNLTEYYIYSTVQLNIQNKPKVMNDCFGGPPTIHHAELWIIPSTIDSLFDLKEKWHSLFIQNSCSTQHLTDFQSVRDAVVLSFLGLQYKAYHLQLAINPLNLRSNISVHHFPLHKFYSKDYLDIQIFVGGKANEQVLYVTCTGQHNPIIYGCSTACEYIVALGNTPLKFPVHTTDPVTPLFYVSTNHSHLERIGKTEFMKVAMLNAKLAHNALIEPHSLKLSTKFWLAVIILIVSFHVIVLKMIYNECRKDRGVVRRR